ncbi:uncharacterized protein LOC142606086 [Castanea sativa]|uniref:uncharacterized protein LOC142606086 n=1 Tax=Castanea sativa TaxID=21020 RepID=UPI003F64CD2D
MDDTNPVEHVSHFNQRMAVHSRNEALICKMFPSSLGPVAMRWFNGLGAGSIDSFKGLTQAFGSCFITCSRVPRSLDSLLSMTMREGETLKTYSDKYWEMFNEIDGDFNDVAIRTFKAELLLHHKQLTCCFENQCIKFWKKIKNEPFFQWPNKMGGDPTKRNQSLHCQYHQERRHATEDCRTLWGYLEQLVRGGKLKQFLYHPIGQGSQAGSGSQRDTSPKPHLGTINVVLAILGKVGFHHSRVLFVAQPLEGEYYPEPKRSRMEGQTMLSFSDDDKAGTLQPHDDALVVTLKIGGYDVK